MRNLVYKLHSYRYVHSKTVLRNVDTKLKVTTSPAGVLSGTSGRHDTTQECISATLNDPSSRSLLSGLHGSKWTALVNDITGLPHHLLQTLHDMMCGLINCY